MDEIKIGFYKDELEKSKLSCYVAKNIFQKTKGLMYKEHLPQEKGMIFIFLIPWIRTFWMKNVVIPLDIIFINRKKEIIKIYEAPVENKIFYKLYNSKGFCRYVIETNLGYCKNNNIKIRDKIRFL